MVGGAAQVLSADRPALPSAKSVRPSRHGRPAVSLSTTANGVGGGSSRRSRMAVRSRAASASGSSGSSSSSPADGPVFEASTPAAAITGPAVDSTTRVNPVLTGGTTLGDHAHGARRDGILAGARPAEPEGLRDHLARHHQAVPGAQRAAARGEGADEQAREVGAGRDLADPDHRKHGEAGLRGGQRHPRVGHAGTAAAIRRAWAAIAAVAGTSLISSGPSNTSTRARRRVVSASAGSTSQPSRKSS